MANTKDLSALLNDEPASSGPSESDVQAEVARKLAMLNPNLKGDGSTAEFVKNAQGALVHTKKPEQKAASPLAQTRDVDHMLETAAVRFEADRRDLETQLTMIQAKLAGLKDRHLQDIMDQFLRLDPNMSSPVTQEALKQRRSFLESIGYSAQRFLEHARKRRSKP